MKNNKGISLTALIITVIVMLILSATTVAVSNIIEKAEIQQITTDMVLIQSKVMILMEKASFYRRYIILYWKPAGVWTL